MNKPNKQQRREERRERRKGLTYCEFMQTKCLSNKRKTKILNSLLQKQSERLKTIQKSYKPII